MDVIEIGRQLLHRRQQLSLRQEDLAEMSSLTVRTIYNIEEGKANPSLRTMHKLCNILGMELTISIKKIN